MDIMDEELQQVLEAFITERLSSFCKKNFKQKEVPDEADIFLEKLRINCPELVTDFNDCLDFVVRNNWPPEQELYFFGFTDAVRLLLSI